MSDPFPFSAPAARLRSASRFRASCWLWALTALCLGAASLGAQAQTAQVLKNLVANHGSLSVGDVVFTNFRTPLIPANLVILGDTFPKLRDGADVTVQASVGADDRINLVLTLIDPATGLPSPYRVDAKTGAALPTDIINYLEFDAVVTNLQRRLHGFDRAFGPGATAVMGSAAFNWVSFFDATNSNQFSPVTNDQLVNGIDFFNAGPVTLSGGDRAGARFAAHWGLNSADWGGVRIGNASLDSLALRFSLANAVAPAVPVALGVSSFFADAVYLSTPAPVSGATIALNSNDPSALTVPASVTVPQGAFYSAYRAQKQPVLNATIATVTGSFNANTTTANECVWVGEAVGSAPLPTLSVALNGKGKVTSASRTINCGIVCGTTPVAGLSTAGPNPSRQRPAAAACSAAGPAPARARTQLPRDRQRPGRCRRHLHRAAFRRWWRGRLQVVGGQEQQRHRHEHTCRHQLRQHLHSQLRRRQCGDLDGHTAAGPGLPQLERGMHRRGVELHRDDERRHQSAGKLLEVTQAPPAVTGRRYFQRVPRDYRPFRAFRSFLVRHVLPAMPAAVAGAALAASVGSAQNHTLHFSEPCTPQWRLGHLPPQMPPKAVLDEYQKKEHELHFSCHRRRTQQSFTPAECDAATEVDPRHCRQHRRSGRLWWWRRRHGQQRRDSVANRARFAWWRWRHRATRHADVDPVDDSASTRCAGVRVLRLWRLFRRPHAHAEPSYRRQRHGALRLRQPAEYLLGRWQPRRFISATSISCCCAMTRWSNR